MRAALIKGRGGLEQLSIGEADDPGEPGPGEVRIAVRHAALNFADTLMLDGSYQETPEVPFIPGMEFAGEVQAVGARTDGIFVGDRAMVFGGSGAFAETAIVPFEKCWLAPPSLEDAQAAAFPVVYGTAEVGLNHRAKLKSGEVLLVTGAGGGVGLAAVEIGKAMGATVIAAASSTDKLALAESRGADHLIDYAKEDLRSRVKELTGGADVVFDPVGGELFGQALRATKPAGRLVIVGFAGGDVQKIPANIALVKNVDIIGLYWGNYATLDPSVMRRSFATLRELFETRHLNPHIDCVLPLSKLEEGYRMLLERRARGKIVIDVAGTA